MKWKLGKNELELTPWFRRLAELALVVVIWLNTHWSVAIALTLLTVRANIQDVLNDRFTEVDRRLMETDKMFVELGNTVLEATQERERRRAKLQADAEKARAEAQTPRAH